MARFHVLNVIDPCSFCNLLLSFINHYYPFYTKVSGFNGLNSFREPDPKTKGLGTPFVILYIKADLSDDPGLGDVQLCFLLTGGCLNLSCRLRKGILSMNSLKLFFILILFAAFQAKAISLEAGPGWSESDRGFQYTRDLLVEHLNSTHFPEFLNRTGLKTIVLHPPPLLLNGKAVGGYAGHDKIDLLGITAASLRDCSVLAEGSADRLNCNLSSGSGEYSKVSFLSRFNHELFHIIDSNLPGMHNSIESQWNQINPPGFGYLSNSLAVAVTTPSLDLHEHLRVYSPNFISEYSSHTIAEDKAEIFAWAVTRPSDFFSTIAYANPAIAEKYALIRQMLDRLTHNNPAILPLPLQGQGE